METRSGRFCAGSRKCKVFRVITAPTWEVFRGNEESVITQTREQVERIDMSDVRILCMTADRLAHYLGNKA